MANILTAQEFIAQGTTPTAIVSIARSNPKARAELLATAGIVARLTGAPMPRFTADNDNRRQRNGAAERSAKRAQERRAA